MSLGYHISEKELDVLRKASEIIAQIDERQKGGVLDSIAQKPKKQTQKERIEQRANKLLGK